ncbi:MAG TPA: nuclear transport factor 2 family protein [Solirubrobacterales bacterium]|nr:nuclear transport factor 2 family protein [Solirubrobacterales bacterium]
MENVEVIREMLDAAVRGDEEAFIAHLTPDVEWDDREGWPGVRQMYHGRAGVRKWWDAFRRVGGRILKAETEDLVAADGNRVLLDVFGTFQGTGGEQTEFNVRAWYVFWIRDSKVARAQLFWTRREALETAGLLEHDQGVP